MIYFLREDDGRDGGEVKIGWTGATSVDPRRLTLQTGNPRDLVLMGTIPGTKAQETRLHEQFAVFRIRPKGEWFRAEPELLGAIRMLLVAEGSPRTVADELSRRNGCRAGIGGVTVAVRGMGADLFVVDSSQWDRDGKLRLAIYPADGPPPVHGLEQLQRLFAASGREALPPGTMVIRGQVCGARADHYPDAIWPMGSFHGVPASDCILMSGWPIVCGCWQSTVGEAI